MKGKLYWQMMRIYIFVFLVILWLYIIEQKLGFKGFELTYYCSL